MNNELLPNENTLFFLNLLTAFAFALFVYVVVICILFWDQDKEVKETKNYNSITNAKLSMDY